MGLVESVCTLDGISSPEVNHRMYQVIRAVLVLWVGVTICFGQAEHKEKPRPLLYTDKGHWVGLSGGLIGGKENIADRWTFTAMYDWRFDKVWSLSCEASVFKRVTNTSNAVQPFRRVENILALSVALKLRISLGRPSTDLFAQAGIGSGSIYPVYHYAGGIECGITERLAVCLRVRRYSPNIDIDKNFFSIGVNLNLTSDRLREGYLQ